MKQYALLPKAEPFALSSKKDRDGEALPLIQDALQNQLLTLYESYAEAFPNPALQEENQERDRLLRALSAANHAVQINPQKQKKSGLWNSLFGKSNEKPIDYDRLDVEEEDLLVYTDVSNDDSASQDFLLGTTCSLDSSCIPEEAHSVARLSLVRQLRTTRRPMPSPPKVARTSWETAGSSCIVVQDLGCILEFQKRSHLPNQDVASTVDCQGRLQYTSDHSQLLDYFDEKGHGGLLGKRGNWTPAEAVAATVGPNLLVVSWGLDVPVVFYRRVATPTETVVDDDHFLVTWEAMAIVGATQIVRESLVDVFSDDCEDSALLSVTDLIPLVVEVPNHAPVVTLAVARLGGFVELVPLPPQMWYGAELPMTKKHILPLHRMKGRGQKRKLGRRGGQIRFTPGNKVPDLAMNPNGGGGIVSLKTTDYHSDILGLSAFRTSVNAVQWNPEIHHDALPPAQYVVVAYGTNNGTGHQIITFWSFSAILSPSAPGGVGFLTHSFFTEAVDLGKVGPDVTLFASPTIFRHWRRPRHIELPASQSKSSSVMVEAGNTHVTTLSLAAPILEICFLVTESLDAIDNTAATRAAVLDWNGGVTLLDCTLLHKSVTNPITDFSADGSSLVFLLADRSVTMREFSKSINSFAPIGISSIQWFQGSSLHSGSHALAALTYDPCSLLLLNPFSNDSNTISPSFTTTTVSCYESSCGKLSLYQKYKRTMCLVVQLSSSICFWAMQELQPADVVRSLINASKFKEAIAIAETLTSTELESIKSIVETCKRCLWESRLDFSSLSSMIDDSYIVDIVLNPHVANLSQQRDQGFLNDDVVLYRSVCRLALERMEASRKMNTSDASKDVINETRSRLLKLGTYELLCRYMSSKPSLYRFFEGFLPASLLELAIFLARRADISSLSIIWFRHPNELQSHRLQVLSEISLSTDPKLFQHLLPVLNPGAAKYKTFGFFMAGLSPQHVMEYSSTFDYLNDQFHVSLRVDEADEALILEGWKRFEINLHGKDEDIGVLANWYCHRTQSVHAFVSSFKMTLYLARLALIGLRIPDGTADTILPSTPLPEVVSLQQKMNFLKLLTESVSEGTVDWMRSSLSFLERKNFEKMDTYDIVCMTMSCKSSTDRILDQYNRFLVPMVKETMPNLQIDELYAAVDSAIQKMCLGLLANCLEGELKDFLGAVSMCCNMIWSSRTSLCKSSRIIKNREIFSRLVLQWTVEVCKMAPRILIEMQDQRLVVDCLWKAFESLPFSKAPHEVGNAELECYFMELDSIRRNIILIDILSWWPSVNAFSVLNDMNMGIDYGYGSTLVGSLCRLFNYQMISYHDSMHLQKTKKLLAALLNDIHEINQHCFGGTLLLSHLFPKHLLKPLLLRRDAPLLDEFLSLVPNDAIDANEILKEATCCLRIVEAGSTIRSTDRGSLEAVIDCLDVLQKWLPELRDKFHEIRRFYEAAFHIADVLLPGKGLLFCLEEFQAIDAMAVFECILEKDSKSIFLNGGNWGDPTWAKQSNDSIRRSLAVNISPDPTADQVKDGIHQPIPFPGQPLLNLAQILGLNDVSYLIQLKAKIVDAGLTMHFFGAAAAVCRSLIADCSAKDVYSTAALWEISKVVNQPNFDDVRTRRELCLSVLALPFKDLYRQMIEPFAATLNALNSLDHRYQVSTPYQDSVLVSVAKLYHDTVDGSSADMAELFSTLNCRLVGGIRDDTLLARLAHYSVFWCIMQTSQPGARPLQSCSTRFVVALAASLILHIQNKTVSEDYLQVLIDAAVENVNDLSGFLNPFGCPDGKIPDPFIMKGLVGRGYSENGARRSVIAAQNAGFREALHWAVSHSFDPGFDDPIVALKRPEHVTDVDFESGNHLKEVLIWIEKILDAPDNESLPFPLRSYEVKAKANSVPMTPNRTVLSKASESANINPVSENGTVPSVGQVSISNDRSNQSISPKASCNVTGAPSLLRVNVPPAVTPVTHVNTPSGERFKAIATVSNSDEPSPDRSVLLHVGQEAFQTAKQHQPTLSPSRPERMRLIEEGRRLLQQARSLSSDTDQRRFSSQSASTTPTSSYVNGKVALPQPTHTKDTVIDPPNMVLAPSADVADAWDFEDENFDLEDD